VGINKSSQKSTSGNQAFDFLRSSLGDSVSYVGEGAKGLSALLGGDSSGFDAYKGATGFNNELIRGMGDVTGASAAKSILRSGTSGKALMNYGQELQNKSAQNYIQNLLGLSGVGGTAAGIIGSAGNTSESSGKSKGLSFKPPAWGG